MIWRSESANMIRVHGFSLVWLPLMCVSFFVLQLLLKKLYVRRMAADLGISWIYPSGKKIFMKTNMNKKVFRLMTEAMTSETHRNSLLFVGKEIKVKTHMSDMQFPKADGTVEENQLAVIIVKIL